MFYTCCYEQCPSTIYDPQKIIVVLENHINIGYRYIPINSLCSNNGFVVLENEMAITVTIVGMKKRYIYRDLKN